MKIYVGNLPYSTREDELESAFSAYGEVVSVTIVMDRDSGRSRGFAFVEMASDSEGQAAIAGLNDSEMDGRTLKVNEARPQPERPPRREGGGGFRGDRGGGNGYVAGDSPHADCLLRAEVRILGAHGAVRHSRPAA